MSLGFSRARRTTALIAALVSVLLLQTTLTVSADTATCTTDATRNTVSTGCFTAAQQTNTLAVLNAFSTAIPTLLNIWTGDDFCAWSQYITCVASGVQVSLSFSTTPIAGTLPEIPDTIVSDEVMMTMFVLTSGASTITGTLPDSWGRLTRLTRLNIYSGGMTGTLPKWTTLTSLQQLQLMVTSVTGTLPAAWSSMASLNVLSVTRSQLSGTVPSAWSVLTKLRTLQLNNNALTGSLPSSWSALTALFNVNLRNNNFCGCVPASWLASSSALSSSTIVDVANTEAGGCATTNVCPGVSSSSSFSSSSTNSASSHTRSSSNKVSGSNSGSSSSRGSSKSDEKHSSSSSESTISSSSGSSAIFSSSSSIPYIPEVDVSDSSSESSTWMSSNDSSEQDSMSSSVNSVFVSSSSGVKQSDSSSNTRSSTNVIASGSSNSRMSSTHGSSSTAHVSSSSGGAASSHGGTATASSSFAPSPVQSDSHVMRDSSSGSSHSSDLGDCLVSHCLRCASGNSRRCSECARSYRLTSLNECASEGDGAQWQSLTIANAALVFAALLLSCF